MISVKDQIRIALGYFLIIAVLGVIMRLFPVFDIPADYRFLVHTHSHVALLGWAYTSITTIIYGLFLHRNELIKKYKVLFWFTQFTIIGMLITFPIEGYGLWSILFSTLFLFASYWFLWFFLKNTSKEIKETQSYKLIRAGLWFMVLSSLGPWTLGAIMNTLGSTSPWYRNAIYFFLHFQYNGWFILAIIGILFAVLRQRDIFLSGRRFKTFYYLLNSGVLLTFFLSILWMQPDILFFVAAGIGGILQIIAIGLLINPVTSFLSKLRQQIPKYVATMVTVSAILFVLKLLAQLVGSIPSAAEVISTNQDLIIAYLHWMFLGIFSLATISFLKYFDLMKVSKITFYIYLIGFLATEGLMIYKGITAWMGTTPIANYSLLLIIASILLTGSICLLFIQQFQKRIR